MEVVFTRHAEEQLALRGLDRELVKRVLAEPQQVEQADEGSFWAQARYRRGDKDHLLRVLFQQHGDTALVITAYTTSRMVKYWRKKR